MKRAGLAGGLAPDVWGFEAALALIAVLLLAVSSFALTAVGIDYESAEGGPLAKLHPATMAAFVVVAAAIVVSPRTLHRIARLLTGHTAVVVFIIAIALLMAYAALVLELPFSPLLDTFGGAVAVYLLFKDPHEQRGRRLAWLIHMLMAANAVIAIGEFATGWRLTPVVVAGMPLGDETRSSALLGHPLANASATACYLLILLLGGGRDLSGPVRAMVLVLNAAAMITFGGRMATVSLIGFAALLAARRLVEILRGARFDIRSVLASLIAVPIGALAIMPLAEAGFFDRFMQRFSDDRGSAVTRWDMFDLFPHFTWHDLLVGPDSAQVDTWRAVLDLEFGIESFWLSFIFFYGILASFAFLAALFAFCHDVTRSAAPRSWLVFVLFFLIGSTSVSIASKSTSLSIIVLLVLVLMRRSWHQRADMPVG